MKSMSKHSRRYNALRKQADSLQHQSTSDVFDKIPAMGNTKFDESVDVAIRLGVNPRHADQMVRGACSLPHGTGRGVRVLVFADGDAARLAEEAGADFVGSQELIDKIKEGWLEFDKTVATRSMMPKVARFLGRILGPRGLMPNPKIGTVVDDAKVADTVGSLKKGKIDFRVEKNGIIHTSIGRASMSSDNLKDNFCTLMATLIRLKPSTAKGIYVRSVTVSTTMGPGVRIDIHDAQRASEGY
jgi:large subunit ribosomal protein L1